MAMGRAQMSRQISMPPNKKRKVKKIVKLKKNAKRRLLQKS